LADRDERRIDAAAVILAGGKSSRMGRPKALLAFEGKPLIAHLVNSLAQNLERVIVVAAPDQLLPELVATVVRDDEPFRGPVAGIYHGLRAVTEEFAFVTSCDAPFLNFSLIRHLRNRAHGWDVVVPVWEQRFQPLHAIYRAAVAPFLEQQLRRNELRPVMLFDRVRTLQVHEEEIRRIDSAGSSFINMNTVADYQAALARWTELKTAEGGNVGT
jgi:molybdopterin-guanine dinucleotide biosynthesis protein A